MAVLTLNGNQSCDNCYVLNIRITNYTSGDVTIDVGNVNNGVFTLIAEADVLTANGTYAVEIDPSTFGCVSFNAIRVTLDSPTTAFYNVLGFFLSKVCAPKLCSRCFQVIEDTDCLLKLSWTNNKDFADLNYSNFDYVQKVWVTGELANATYPIENDVHRYSNGDTLLTFGRRIKTMQLALNDLPEFIHNAISLGLIHDEFYVNGIQYRAASDAYDPIWRRTAKVAPVIVELFKKQENSRNQLC